MENYSHSSHPNSRDSSPRSREIENENSSFEEPPPSNNTYKVKFMCSYGGKIQPRPHDNQLTYVGGDTKIIAVDRSIKFSAVMAKLNSLTNIEVCFKYQLPGEDLDALISVTNEEDLDHMMVEYDRLCRASPRPARLRLFLFPLNNASSSVINLMSTESKPERQWFVDALNSIQVPILESSSPPPPPPPAQPVNPDFLFGLDKPAKTADLVTVPEIAAKDSECGPEDKQTVREPEILKIGNNNEQSTTLQRKNDEESGRVNGLECYFQKNSEKVTPLISHAAAQTHSGSVPVQVSGPLPVQASFPYPLPVSANGTEPVPVYFIQTPSGMFQAVRPVTGPVGQPVYFMQTPVSVSQSAHKVAYNGSQVAYLPDRSTFRQQAAAAPGGNGWN